MTVESVIKTHKNAELIAQVAKLWIKPDDLVLDATYGKGNWWTVFTPQHWRTNDLDPTSSADYHHDFRAFPEKWNGEYDVVAFDPPYVTKGGRTTSGIKEMDDRYGLTDAPLTPEGLWGFMDEGIAGCAKVLKRGGRLLLKCSDYVSSGQYQDGYVNAYLLGKKAGLKHVDTFIHHSGLGPQPKTNLDGTPRRQVHSRRSHSYLLVLQA